MLMKHKLQNVILLSLFLISINLNAQYCNFNVTDVDDEDITSVQIIGANGTFINNQTSCSAPTAPTSSQFNYYGAAAKNKEGKVIPPLVLVPGRSYSITVEMAWCGTGSYSNFIKVWIDYNNNFVFDQPSELVFSNSDIRQTNGSVNPGPISYTSPPFTVPVGARIANTRMRVALYESAGATAMPAAFTPCSGATWGEAEDYDLIISGGSTFDIVAFNSPNGSITPTGTTTLSQGSSQRYTFTPNAGYLVDSVIVDGNKVDSASGYTFSSLTSNHTIRVTYKALNIPSYVPTIGLVGWWPFNGNANDESGNGNHGTVYGASMTSNRFNQPNSAYFFNGVNGTSIKTNYTGILGDSSRTISFWTKRNALIYNASFILTWGKPTTNTFNTQGGNCYAAFVGKNGSGQPFIGIDNGGSVMGTTTNSAIDSIWHNYTIVYNRNTGQSVTNIKIYIDGILSQNNVSFAPKNINTVSDLKLTVGEYWSQGGDYRTYNGQIDDIAIYNRALTQQEITALYTGVVTKDIVASSGANGSISPSGTTSVNSGSNQTYIFTPNPGYWIDSVIVNGVQVPTASSYTFNNVSSDQTIRVTYRSLAAALAAANICSNDTLVSTVNLPALSNVRATTYYSNIYLFNQNNTNNAYKYNVNDRKYNAIANKPSPCIECGVAEANGKVYCFNTNGTSEAYDIATNTWQNQANQTSTSTSSVYAASINNKIYVLGTNNNQNTFTQYNPQTNSYTALANPTINANQSRLVAYNNKLYKIGGTDNNNQPIAGVEVYNPTNNTWTAMPDLPEALTQVGATYYDNKLYVFGGKQISNTNSNKVYVFDFTSNAWYAESNTQNTNRTNIESKTANNMVFLFGGSDTTNIQSNQAQRYFCKDQLCTCKWAEYVCNGVSQDEPCPLPLPSLSSLQQDTTANTGNLYNSTAANNVTVTLNYTGASGASYKERAISSIGVTGLTATLAAGTLNNGNGTLVLSISGTPNASGTASFSITIGGKTCVFTRTVITDLVVGLWHQGGIIGYVYQPGDIGFVAGEKHGIIVAPIDQSTGSEFGCFGSFIGNTSPSIGSGLVNTNKIVNECSEANIAAKICFDLNLNGYDDWYLPSLGELGQLLTNQFVINAGSLANGGNLFENTYYRTSTEVSAGNAFVYNFSNGLHYDNMPKFASFNVRAIRSF